MKTAAERSCRMMLDQALRQATDPRRLRRYMRREYEHLRALGIDRHTAKGTIARTLDIGVEMFVRDVAR